MKLFKAHSLRKILLFSTLSTLFFCGCSSTKYTYRQIEDDQDPYTAHKFQCSPDELHKAVVQVLLTKKFIIEHEDATGGTLNASRVFSKGYQTIVVVVQSKIISKNGA